MASHQDLHWLPLIQQVLDTTLEVEVSDYLGLILL